MSRWSLWVACVAVLWLVGVPASFAVDPAASNEQVQKPVPHSPLTPEESQKHFQIDPDCRIELVAAEPDVSAPVAIAFDEKGQLWVVEMHDYPNGPAPGEPGKSRIRVLTDEDGDGRYSNPRVFVDQLLFANGLMHWDGGVLVTTDGKLIYFKDTDGDGKSDLREVWFEGFATENPQLRCNHPTFGPDNWIYVANGLRNGKVRAVRPEWPKPAPESAKLGEPVDIAGRDFRFHPFTGECEAVSGYGQFGLTFDDEGNRYVCSNRNPCMKVIIEERHLKLNPNLAVPSVVEDISPAGEQSKLYPISRAWTTSNLHAGQFSAACGLIFYRGTALPSEFYGQSFTCDPTGNLVHFDYWHRPDDQRPQGKEFLASDETWFRPVNSAMGPDGALYIVDMYRAVVEHPDYMPAELKTRPDLKIGAERGRIWRVVGQGERGGVSPPSLPLPTDSVEIAKLVVHPNGWHRDTAHRMLIEKQSYETEETLRGLILSEESKRGKDGAAVALRTLHGLEQITSKDLTEIIRRETASLPVGTKASQPQSVYRAIARTAIQLAEDYVADDADLSKAVIAFTEKYSPTLARADVHLTLGRLGERERESRVKLGLSLAYIPLQTALGEGPFLPEIIQQLLKKDRGTGRSIIPAYLIQAATRGAKPEELAPLFEALVDASAKREVLIMIETLPSRGVALDSLLQDAMIKDKWNALLEQTAKECADRSLADDQLAVKIPLLRHAAHETAVTAIRDLLKNATPTLLKPAIETASTLADPDGFDLITQDFSFRTPSIRNLILDGLLRSEPRITKLLDLVESNQISFLEIGQTRLASLQQVKNPEIQQRLKKLIAANAPADRSKVLEEYQAALTHVSDPLRGRELFAKNCAQCHKIGDLGVDVAPNISDSRVKTQAQLLVDILDPNRAIDNNYFSYTLVDTSGKVATGIISSETSSSVTMKQPEAKTITVLRSEIEQLKPNGVSLMPVGFEKQLSVAQMADVISFIKNWRYLDGQVPKEVIR